MFGLLLSIAGCSVNTDDAVSGNTSDSIGKAKAICLDGVQYWTNGGQLAVRVDPKSLLPKKCISE